MKFSLSNLEVFIATAGLAVSTFVSREFATKGRGLLDEPKESLLGQGEGTVTCVRSALRRNLLARTRLWEFAWTRFFDQSVKLLRGR